MICRDNFRFIGLNRPAEFLPPPFALRILHSTYTTILVILHARLCRFYGGEDSAN